MKKGTGLEIGLKEGDSAHNLMRLPRSTLTSRKLRSGLCFTPTIHRLLMQTGAEGGGMWIIFEFKAVPESVFGVWWEDAMFERLRDCLLRDEKMSSMEVALKVVGRSELVCKLGLSEQVEPKAFEDSELSGLEGLAGKLQYAEKNENNPETDREVATACRSVDLGAVGFRDSALVVELGVEKVSQSEGLRIVGV